VEITLAVFAPAAAMLHGELVGVQGTAAHGLLLSSSFCLEPTIVESLSAAVVVLAGVIVVVEMCVFDVGDIACALRDRSHASAAQSAAACINPSDAIIALTLEVWRCCICIAEVESEVEDASSTDRAVEGDVDVVVVDVIVVCSHSCC